MEYRKVEYTIAQGIGWHMWTWSTPTVAGVTVMGRSDSKAGAIAAVEKAIDKVLCVNKVRLVPPLALRLKR
jgi:hypothetical protein